MSLPVLLTRRIKDLIENAVKDGLTRIDAYYLMSHVLGKSREYIYANPDVKLSFLQYVHWIFSIKRRKRGIPANYITGEREFYSINFLVRRGVLIPRPETEILVDEILKYNPDSLLDIGTGSGNIAISVKYHLPACRITAVDKSSKALRVARKNCLKVFGKCEIEFIKSDFFNSLGPRKFRVIASNPPYIPAGTLKVLQVEVSRFEPIMALNGGSDGLKAYRRILAECGGYLEDDGMVMLEVSEEIIKGVVDLARRYGFSAVAVKEDLANRPRVLILRKL